MNEQALQLAALFAAFRFAPLALLLPIPLDAARWPLRLAAAALLVALGTLFLAPSVATAADWTPAELRNALLREAATGLAMAMAVALALPVGGIFGALFDALVPEWRSARPFARVFDLLIVVLAFSATLHLSAVQLLLSSYELVPLSAASPSLGDWSETMLSVLRSGSALFAIAFATALPFLVAVALVEAVLAIAVRLSGWPAAAPMAIRPLLVLVFMLAGAFAASAALLDWLQQRLLA